MNVLFVVAELAPLAKVGGVGDVGGALPRALRKLGADVRVAVPYYRAIDRRRFPAERVADLPTGAALWRTDVRDVPVYLVEHEPAFGREQVYGYEDDTARFLAFCDGILASAEVLDWRPDAIHLNDWHTGLLAARLNDQPDHPWAAAARVFTIHNLGYAGAFDAAFARKHGLGGSAVRPASALGQGIVHADFVTTVSPTYAREILSPEHAGELAPLLQRLDDRLCGILNGIDAEEFDPAADPDLAARFDAEHIERRTENKRALQRALGLPEDGAPPLVGMVTRLVEQKGPDLATEAIGKLLAGGRSLQLAVLGQGDGRYERALGALAQRYPRQVAVRIAFDPPLGQLIYGGCDIFLMPSRYEPCGLGQMIAMRYGAVPVVRRTGGLADSVEQHDPARDRGTGFLFDEATPDALAAALEEALRAYEDRPSWRRLQLRAMAQDFSWERSAREYLHLYEQAIEVRAAALRPAERQR